MTKPMLASAVELHEVRYPIYASPKLDGVRGLVIDGKLHSRSLKPIANRHVQQQFSRPEFSGLDGEFILGSPTAHDVYRVTNAALARHDGQPPVTFYVFDDHSKKHVNWTFERRLNSLQDIGDTRIEVVNHVLVENEGELLEMERMMLTLGYEGLILRCPNGPYKYGRSTVREGWMLKLKRFQDSEAEILEVIEEMENTNEAQTSELGRTKRSSHQAGLVPKGRAGALRVRDVHTSVEFQIGTGLNDADKAYYWQHRKAAVGKLIKYKSFNIGVKDKPRFPVYLGGREKWDMS